jgi:hypothetical protein
VSMLGEFVSLIPITAGGSLAIICLFVAFINFRRKRILDDLPTSKTQGVFIGQVELKGTAESETPLVSYLASVRCVQYSWYVDENWSRTVSETYTDSKGHVQTRSRIESGWTRVASGEKSSLFYLKDDTGVIRINPEGANIQGKHTFNETCTPSRALYYEKGPPDSISNSTHKRRFHETAIELHTMLYILGQSRERQDIVAAEVASANNSDLFLISTKSEKQLSRNYGLWYLLFVILGGLTSAGAAWIWAIAIKPNFGLGWKPFTIMIGGYIIVFASSWIWVTYNSLINLHHRVEQGWSQLHVQLKRRNDLIPSLVKMIEGYRDFESETQKIFSEIRTRLSVVSPSMEGLNLKGVTPMFRIVIEKYPELKADLMFMQLQQNLVDTEQRIALAGGYFNNVATLFNTRLEVIPDRFVAFLAGLHQRPLMVTAEFERAPIQVSLSE